MVFLKEKKLSIVMAFILGTTMFSSMDKAWGMSDEAEKSSVSAAPRFFLAGTTRVSGKARKAAEILLDAFTQRPALSNESKRQTDFRKAFITAQDGTGLRQDIVPLFQGGFVSLLVDIDSETPGLPFNALVIRGLEVIKGAVDEDPYDIITHNESISVISAADRDAMKEFLLTAKKEAKLSEFFFANLPNLVTPFPTIVNSLLARFPREEEKIAQQKSNLEIYFLGRAAKAADKSKMKLEFHNKLDALVEAFCFLKQIDDRSALSPLPAPVPPGLLSSSSSSSSYSSSGSVGLRKTFRTTGENLSARNKHSAVSIRLPNQELQDDAYGLVINQRTREKGSMVRIYDPKTQTYNELEALPVSPDFDDKFFDITFWAKAVRDDSSVKTDVATYLSFLNGKSDIHSFKIQSGGNTLKEIIFGDADSERQAGVHVYGPETDGNAHEWSKTQSDEQE